MDWSLEFAFFFGSKLYHEFTFELSSDLVLEKMRSEIKQANSNLAYDQFGERNEWFHPSALFPETTYIVDLDKTWGVLASLL